MFSDCSKKIQNFFGWRGGKLRHEWGVFGALTVPLVAEVVAVLVVEFLYSISSIAAIAGNDLNTLLGVMSAVVMFGVVFLGLRIYRQNLLFVGFDRPRLSYLKMALIGLGVYVFVTVVISMVAGLLLQYDQEQAQELGYSGLGGLSLIGAFLLLVVVAPLLEELLFRGFIYKGIRRRFSFVWTAIFVSVIFAFAHGQWNVGLDVFALSLVLCYMREKSDSLWPGVFLHAMKNFLAFVLLYLYI